MMLVALAGIGAIGSYRWRRSLRTKAAATRATYVPFRRDVANDYSNYLVVDSTHPSAATLTHHKGHNNVPGVHPLDCSTGYVISALKAEKTGPSTVQQALSKSQVTCDHFDIDAVLSIWCWINRAAALRHEKVLLTAARIGDFREAALPALYRDGTAPAEARADGVADDKATVTRALQLCCWLSAQEVARFSAPFECKDAEAKYDYFLGALGDALEHGPPVAEWSAEYDTVMGGLEAVRQEGSITHHPDIGVTVVHAPRRLHYYSLFSHSIGSDVVVSVYPNNCFEVECKYTQFVRLASRPVVARLDLQPLAKALNEREAQPGVQWGCARLIDSGPILRLDAAGKQLSKQQRYGHPTDRPVLSSSIPADKFLQIVVSFFEHGLRGLEPRAGGWQTWGDLHAVNAAIDWQAWRIPDAL